MNYLMHGFNIGGMAGFGGWMSPLFLVVLIWSLFWKGLGLWHSARHGQGWWFIALLLINTVGILEIVYLFAVLKIPRSQLFDFKK